MPQLNDLSRSLVALEQDATLIAVIEMGQSSWLVAGVVPGIERQPLKKLAADPDGLLQLLHRWRHEAVRAGRTIKRIAVAYEAGRDGFWLARWLRAREIEAYVIHASSVPVSREHRRAKTDRLDSYSSVPFSARCAANRSTAAWLRSPHLRMRMQDGRAASARASSRECTRIVNRVKANLARLGIRGFRPSLAQASRQLETLRTPEGAAVPTNTLAELRRDMTRLCFVRRQIKEIETTRAKRLERPAREGRNAMVHLLARVVGVGVETADMLVQEVFSRNLRDRKAVARYSGLTGAPDESGQKRRERGLAKAGRTAR